MDKGGFRERIKALAAHLWHLGNATKFKVSRQKSPGIIKPRKKPNRIVLNKKHLLKFNVHTKKGSLLKFKKYLLLIRDYLHYGQIEHKAS